MMSAVTLSILCTCFIVIINAANNCTVQQNVDYYQPGNPSQPCDNVQDCCNMCFERHDCFYWTLYDGLCYFKDTNQGQQVSNGRISGHCLGKNASNNSEPEKYILSFPTMDNPLNISVAPQPEKNYFMLIGDWGAHDSDTTDVKVQTAVAQKMISFYNQQKQNGYNLLFTAALGDNFYHSGQNCQYYQKRWTDMYGEIATEHPWFAIMGNHDWGFDDAHAMCAWGAPNIGYVDPNTNIPYAANQINIDKKGCNPRNYYLPDFGYYYWIKELNLEVIGVEESVSICPTDMDNDYEDCNDSSQVGCAYLGRMRDASEQMLIERANVSKATNFLIIQHYPGVGQRLVDLFKSHRINNGNNDRVWSAYGHTHQQQCDRTNTKGNCDAIMSGGGGGCCGEVSIRGFYVVGFDENKNMIQPYKTNDPLISCLYPCGAEFTEDEIVASMFSHCCYTSDKQNCHMFDLTKC